MVRFHVKIIEVQFSILFLVIALQKNWHLKNDKFTFITKFWNLTLAIMFGMVSPMFVPNIVTLYGNMTWIWSISCEICKISNFNLIFRLWRPKSRTKWSIRFYTTSKHIRLTRMEEDGEAASEVLSIHWGGWRRAHDSDLADARVPPGGDSRQGDGACEKGREREERGGCP